MPTWHTKAMVRRQEDQEERRPKEGEPIEPALERTSAHGVRCFPFALTDELKNQRGGW
jgi:hypothetical protein